MKRNTTAKDAILETAATLSLEMKAEFVPFSRSRNKGNKYPSLNWEVTISRAGKPILTTDYSTGQGHCPSYKQGDNSNDRDVAVLLECENGRMSRIGHGPVYTATGTKLLMPELSDVLYSLANDSDVLNYSSFEDWALNFGYDKDSRAAETIYRACLDIALKLRNALGEDGLHQLIEACQDY